MKNKFLEKVLDARIWAIIFIILCFRIIIYSDYNEYSVYYDTLSYVDYQANILKGEIDAFRTPIYPYIIKLISTLNFTNIADYMYISLFQEIISIISVIILYITLRKTFKNQIVTYIATILYGCIPVIFTYNKVILTESLSISFFVMYCCLIIRYIANPTNKKTIAIGIFTIFLILLRPSFLYLLIAEFMIFGLIFICKKENRKQALLGGIVLACVVIIILGYCLLNKIQNGFFGLSNVTQINQLDTIIQMGIYKTGDERDNGIIEIIEQKLDGNIATWYTETTSTIKEEYTPSQIDEYISRCIKNNFSEYVNKTIAKIGNISTQYSDEIYLKKVEENLIEPIVPFIFIYLYIFFEAIYILIKSIRNRQIPLEQAIMLILVLGQLATIILGAQAEYSRLFVVALPVIIISIVWHIEEIIQWYKLYTTNEEENKIENEQ